jgi:phosphoglycerate dehydrogenase-like enzyme
VTPRVIVHTAEPVPHVAAVRAAVPGATVEGGDSYLALPARVADFAPDVVFTIRFAGSTNYPAAALTGPGGPRWIAVGGSGTDHLAGWDPARTMATNAAGVVAAQMAAFAIGAALHVFPDMPGLTADQAARHWRRDRLMRRLRGATCLVVGLGRTGMAVADRARAMGMRVIGVRANPAPAEGVAVRATVDLPALWGAADVIVVCVPLTPATQGLIGAAEIAAMRADAVIVDVTRGGGVIDGVALAAALASGHLAGAALDVFETEPMQTGVAGGTAPSATIGAASAICPRSNTVSSGVTPIPAQIAAAR